MVLLEYYREHKPDLATEQKCLGVINTFQKKAAATAKASINSIGPSWRSLMYDSIAQRSGVDPREHYDLTIAGAVATKATSRQRQRTEAAVATRRLAWEDGDRQQRERELPLDERRQRVASHAADEERDLLSKPWRREHPQTINVTVPPDGFPGKRLTIKLPNGTTVYPVVPENCPPGQTFSTAAVPPKPDIASIGGGHRVMVDSGREPYAKQFEVLSETLNPAHPSMPHIDHWQEPQYNPTKPGGAAESEYADRYLGFWREDTELNDGAFFARMPESRVDQPWPEKRFPEQDFFFKEIPKSAHPLQAEHGSKRAEMRRYLGGNHGTLQGPHAEMLLQDSINANRAADEKTLFKNRRSTMLSGQAKAKGQGKAQGQAKGQGKGQAKGQGERTSGSSGMPGTIQLRKRYMVASGGTGGQGCEIQICVGDLTKCGLDALITPAQPHLGPGGMGLNSRIHSAAGHVFSRLTARVPEVSPGLRCDTGSAVATASGELAVAKVIHAVGPVHPSAPRWHQLVYAGKHARFSDPPLGVPTNYRNYEANQVPKLLCGAYTAALKLANQANLRTLSTPALACDDGGYPCKEAAEIAFETCCNRQQIGGLELIQFVLTDDSQEQAFLKEASKQVRFGVLQVANKGADPRTGEGEDHLTPQASAADAAAAAAAAGNVSNHAVERTGSEQQQAVDDGRSTAGLSDEQATLLKAFREFDLDGNGSVNPAEFRQGLNRCDIELPKANLIKMMEQLSDQKLDSVWSNIDLDGSGDVDASELKAVLEVMGNQMTADDTERLARRLDRDHDGTISKSEFRKWWARQPAHMKEKVLEIRYHDFVKTFDPMEHTLRRLFNDIDESGDGTLDGNEIWRLCRDMGAELDTRELKEAMREMDADGSGEVDFDEFYAWMTQTRKHSRKLAQAMSEFRAKRAAGATRQERPYGRPTGGRAGDETFERAKDAYLPHKTTRKKLPDTAAVTQLDEEYYTRQQHAGVPFGEPAVTAKPGQQAGAGTRESHYQGPRGAAEGTRDPNGYVPYKPHDEIITAILTRMTAGWRKAKIASLRKELEGLRASDLREKARTAGLDQELVRSWWEGVGARTQSTVAKNANEDDHYTLVPPWDGIVGGYKEDRDGKAAGHLGRISNQRVGRYIGLVKEKEEVSAKEDLMGIQQHTDELHTWIDPRSCWVGGIPRKHASEHAMRAVFEDHGMNVVSITVRVKNRVTASRGTPMMANRSWALVEFIDKGTAMRARKAKVMVDDEQHNAVALKIREAQVEEHLAQQRANAEQESTNKAAREMAADAAVDEGEIERVSVNYPLNEGGWGAASVWEKGHRDEAGQPQGRMSYPVVDGTDEPPTKGRWIGGGEESRSGFKATLEQKGKLGNTAQAGGISKENRKWGDPQYDAPGRPKAKSDVHSAVVDAIVKTVAPSKHAALRRELGGIKVRELRERAIAAEIASSIINKWWSVVGEKMQSEMVRDARHVSVHWNKRYVGRNPDEPFAGWGEKPGQRDRLRYS